jgi:putative ATP-dependent endonuclease of the OLD family
VVANCWKGPVTRFAAALDALSNGMVIGNKPVFWMILMSPSDVPAKPVMLIAELDDIFTTAAVAQPVGVQSLVLAISAAGLIGAIKAKLPGICVTGIVFRYASEPRPSSVCCAAKLAAVSIARPAEVLSEIAVDKCVWDTAALIGTPGVSLAASVGLTVGESDSVALPLTSWGTGTRRLAALEISTLGVSADTIAVIDEPETGLEPYRQRVFIRDLASTTRQAFVTTHSPAVLAQSLYATAQPWRIDDPAQCQKIQEPATSVDCAASHALVAIGGAELIAVAKTQPEALFAKLPVICEGITEVGFVSRLFEHRFGSGFSCRGIFCLDAGGHYRALPICKQFIGAGFSPAAVVDDEGKKSGGWADVASSAILLRWQSGTCLEKAVLSAMPDSALQMVHEWPARSAAHQLAELRGELLVDKGLSATEMFAGVGRVRYLEALLKRACPPPDSNRKPRGWFKSLEGGQLLAEKLLSVIPRPAIFDQIDVFLTAVEKVTEA